jgi:hypothetical protein
MSAICQRYSPLATPLALDCPEVVHGTTLVLKDQPTVVVTVTFAIHFTSLCLRLVLPIDVIISSDMSLFIPHL